MWFSSGGTSSVIHTDDYENILCVLDGVKQVVLVDSDKFPHVIEVSFKIFYILKNDDFYKYLFSNTLSLNYN